MSTKQFTLTTAKALPDGVLQLTFADGAEMQVQVLPLIEGYPVFAPLRDAFTFHRAKVIDSGRCVSWGTDFLEMAADNLRVCAIKQAGGHSHELSESGIPLPTDEEDAAIARGIAADPDTLELTAESAATMQLLKRRPHPEA